ncbi:exonuclease SbcCD subunit D [Paenibacillus pinihumi]|uniref:exonuclease SbcCD subunit D n=1 Tax=Paenibacillus pinihumi TaxID=669462 RepID=UPI00048B56D3|nr:exonuclease SbcCD subunit D [Paenibacillus pinihumi]
MKLLHTADWHLGKLVQGVYMTEDQRYVLEQLIEVVQQEKPDAVIIAGDLYDRAIPPTEAVELLNEVLERLVIELETPVMAISGNHDSPDRIGFGTRMMQRQGLYLAGQLKQEIEPVVLRDEAGEVHFYLVPYADPAQVRYALEDESIRTHDEAMKAVLDRITEKLDPAARHVLVGHAFVTPGGEPQSNTSESERPLSIGGAEHVRAEYFHPFHYTALGHLHQAHYVSREDIRYAGSPLKYSISEENHNKGYYMVHIAADGAVQVEKRELAARRDMRRVAVTLEELETHSRCEDYVFVTLISDNPVLFPMEKVRAFYPNALHVERRAQAEAAAAQQERTASVGRRKADPVELFEAFYEEVKGMKLGSGKKQLFAEAYDRVLREDGGAV